MWREGVYRFDFRLEKVQPQPMASVQAIYFLHDLHKYMHILPARRLPIYTKLYLYAVTLPPTLNSDVQFIRAIAQKHPRWR